MEGTKTSQNAQGQEKTFPATVVWVINSTQLAINRGSIHDLRMGQRMIVYALSSEEIIDPVSGESLGLLEIVKGTGKITHLQEKMAILESDRKKYRRKIVRPPLSASDMYFSTTDLLLRQEEVLEEEGELHPFDDPQVGDRVKPI